MAFLKRAKREKALKKRLAARKEVTETMPAG